MSESSTSMPTLRPQVEMWTRCSSPHRVPKRLSCPVVIRFIFPSIREHRNVEILSEVRPIDVRHCPLTLFRPHFGTRGA